MEQFLEYFGLVVGSWYGMLALIAFGLTLGLQAARRRMGGRRYRALWGIMLVLGGMWGGFALWQYVQNFVHWYDAYFLIPGVLVWVGLAKLQQRLPWGVYLSIVLNIAVVIWASQWVMAQHVVEADPKSNGERLKFNMHEWLSGRGWPGKAVPSAGSGGGPGVGGFVMLFPNGEPTLEWIFYWSWGIPLLASALAVPAWRMFQPKGGRRRENGRSARLNVVTPPRHREF